MKSYEEMAQSVLIRRDEYLIARKKKNNKIASGLICLALILGIGIGVTGIPGREDIPKASESTGVAAKPGDDVVVVNEISIALSDMDVRTEDYSKVKYPIDEWNSILFDFKEFTGLDFNSFCAKFTDRYDLTGFNSVLKGNGSGKKSSYKMHDYVLCFGNSSGSKKFTVSLSPIGKPMRDIFLICDEPGYSEINGKQICISGNEDHYYAEFEADGIFYDIEAEGLEISEFVSSLKNLIS